MDHSIRGVSNVVSQSPFPRSVMIIHHGNGTASEHNYMPQMSFCVPHWRGLAAAGRKKVPGRELRREQASKKALWVQEERSSSRKDWSLDPSTHVTSQASLEMSVTPAPRVGWRKDCWGLPASGPAETKVSCSGRAFMSKE